MKTSILRVMFVMVALLIGASPSWADRLQVRQSDGTWTWVGGVNDAIKVVIADGEVSEGGGATAANQVTQNGYLDGLEGLITSTNSALATTNSTLSSTNTKLDTLDGRVDGLETLITSTNTKLDSVISGQLAPVAHDAVDSGSNLKIGCQARTTVRTAVADGDRADCLTDKNSRLVVTFSPRERVVRSGVVTLTNTTETTLIAAGGAGVFRDLTYLKCTNTSASLVRVDLRDATGGTVIDTWALAASGGGFNIAFPVPHPQATANNNWTVQLSGSVTDVRCSAIARETN